MSKFKCKFCTENIFDCHINRDGFVAFVKPTCPHSRMAMKTIRDLSKKIGYDYKFYNVNDKRYKGLVKVLKDYLDTDRFTVPQIFLNGEYIGGNDRLQNIKYELYTFKRLRRRRST